MEDKSQAILAKYLNENNLTLFGDVDVGFLLNDPSPKIYYFLGLEHADLFLDKDGRPYSLVIQPYRRLLTDEHFDAWRAFCKEHHLRYSVLSGADWYAPGRTVAVQFTHDNNPMWEALPTYEEFQLAREAWTGGSAQTLNTDTGPGFRPEENFIF